MSRPLSTAQALPAEAAAQASRRFAESPDTWWPDGVRRHGGAWHGQVRLGRLARPVLAEVGAPWVDGPTTWRALRWTAVRRSAAGGLEPDPRLPDFSGALGLRRQPGGPAVLLLRGTYDPPGGWIGNAVDALVLGTAADRTAQQLLADVAERLGAGVGTSVEV